MGKGSPLDRLRQAAHGSAALGPIGRSALNSHTIEHKLPFPSGHVEIRKYDWETSTIDTWAVSDCYFFDLSLMPEQRPAMGKYLIDRSSTKLEKIGNIFMIPPGFQFKSGSRSGIHHSMHFMMSSSLVENLLRGKPRWTQNALSKGLRLSSPDIEWLLREMHHEACRPKFAAQAKVESLANALAVEVIRYFDLECSNTLPVSGGLAPWRMKLIRDRVRSEEPLPSLGELAELCGITARHLSRAFKSETNQTIREYIESAMIERAMSLLTDTDASVAAIAERLGFSSHASFAYAFRRATGWSPREVRCGRHLS